MTIEGRALSVGGLLALGRFRPARVQREYRWTELQQTRLVEDLELALGRAGHDPDGADPERPRPTSGASRRVNEYFLGSMVFARTRESDLFQIFDGQQRLTTTALLLAALRDTLAEGRVRDRVLHGLLQDDGEPRLGAPSPGGAVRRITREAGGTTGYHGQGSSMADFLLSDGVKRLLRLVSRWSEAKRDAFARHLLDDVHVTVTFVDDPQVAEVAYVTVNTRGRKLDQADVLKGQVVQVVSQISREEGRQVAERWDQLRRDLRDDFEPLLGAIDFMRFGRPRTSGLVSGLLDRFERDPDGSAEARRFVLDDVPRYWRSFRTIARLPTGNADLSMRELHLRQLGFLGWTEWKAVALRMLDDEGPRTDGWIAQLLRSCYTMHLLGWASDRERRCGHLEDALSDLAAGRDPFRRPSRELDEPEGPLFFGPVKRRQARSALRSAMPDHRTYGPIVRLAETVLWYDAGHRPGFAGRGTVEHVLPRAHSPRVWREAFPDDDEREQLKSMLGNLTLLPRAVNREIGNAGFAEKRQAMQALGDEHRSARSIARESRGPPRRSGGERSVWPTRWRATSTSPDPRGAGRRLPSIEPWLSGFLGARQPPPLPDPHGHCV